MPTQCQTKVLTLYLVALRNLREKKVILVPMVHHQLDPEHGPAGPPMVMKTLNCRSWQAEAPAPHWFFVGQALSPANQFLSHLDRVFNGVPMGPLAQQW
jgi:hypothetical protein